MELEKEMKEYTCPQELEECMEEFFELVERCKVKRCIPFSKIAHHLTPALIEAIAHSTKKKYSLLKLVRQVAPSGRFDCWKHILDCRDRLPKDLLFQIWYRMFNDRSNAYYQEVDVLFGKVAYFANLHETELLSHLPLSDFLLVDNPCVKLRYTQVQKPGWEMLRAMMGRRWQTLRLPEMLRSAIDEDDPGKFNIARDMSGQNLSFSLLGEVMAKKSLKVFRMLLKESELLDKIIPLDELCGYCAGFFDDDRSVPFLDTIEETFPGTLKKIRDAWGRNLLWYALHNHKTIWFHPKCQLTQCLLKHGCDPDNVNQLGLSWRYVTENLSFVQKGQQMSWRYGTSCWGFGNSLRKTQPPEDIAM